MSIHLMSLVWEIEFPTATQKLIMLRLADYADDDGNSVFPSIDRLAHQVGASRRQTQYAVRALEGAGLLECVHKGGNGSRDTNKWVIAVDVIVRLAMNEAILTGVHDALEVVENEGAIIAPYVLARVQSAALRVQSATNKGATHCTRPSTTHQIEPPTRASAREGGDIYDLEVKGSKPPGRRPIASFVIRRGDAQWQAWIATLQERDATLAAGAEASGEIIALGSKWPDQAEWPPIVHTKELTRQSRRMAGERV